DLLVTLVLVVALRSVTSTFVSVYVIDDTVWLGLALLQGLVFQWWREVSARQAVAVALEQAGNLGERGDTLRKGDVHAAHSARGRFHLLRGVRPRVPHSHVRTGRAAVDHRGLEPSGRAGEPDHRVLRRLPRDRDGPAQRRRPVARSYQPERRVAH